MELLANDLSIHGQFHDMAAFRDALINLMAVRTVAKRFGRELQCHGKFLSTEPIQGVTMQQAIGNFMIESERRAIMVWLTRFGPFWDDERRHQEDDWVEYCGDIVTDTAVGEAAYRTLHGSKCGVVSVSPSDWLISPLMVTLRLGQNWGGNRSSNVTNFWSVEALDEVLREEIPPPRSWTELDNTSATRFPNLTFTSDCFSPLSGVPFSKGAANRFIHLLGTLDRFASAFDESGSRNAEGHRIYQEYFTGERALFSDSSDTEKQRFNNEMTFAHPEGDDEPIFCPWHGKISRLNLRLHFSWPVYHNQPVYIVYAGPKITKQ